jgi:hypothetical protein
MPAGSSAITAMQASKLPFAATAPATSMFCLQLAKVMTSSAPATQAALTAYHCLLPTPCQHQQQLLLLVLVQLRAASPSV